MAQTQQIEFGKWEQRWHPLRREWIVYAAHRNSRPWSGAAAPEKKSAPAYDPKCYLCPGNPRVHGAANPDYKDVFIFDNDHPVVGMAAPEIPAAAAALGGGLYRRERAAGIARVVCYDPRHNVTLSEIPVGSVAKVFVAWREETRRLANTPDIRFVLIFENKGEAVGVSNPHPHCQIYATRFPFTLVERSIAAADAHRQDCGRNLFADVIAAEQADGARVLAENRHAIGFVPFFARYAYETMIFPKRRHATLMTMSDAELFDLAAVFQQVIRRYDLLFKESMPYVMSILQAPVDGRGNGEHPEYHLHLLIQPPLRQPGLVKFLAGPEIGGGNFMADTMPEDKARELLSVDPATFPEAPTV
ncbi:MAG: galactose-1-phosphate uridylyltransferase [Planctomycetota bacterium]